MGAERVCNPKIRRQSETGTSSFSRWDPDRRASGHRRGPGEARRRGRPMRWDVGKGHWTSLRAAVWPISWPVLKSSASTPTRPCARHSNVKDGRGRCRAQSGLRLPRFRPSLVIHFPSAGERGTKSGGQRQLTSKAEVRVGFVRSACWSRTVGHSYVREEVGQPVNLNTAA